MRSFTDSADRQWQLEITPVEMKRVMDATGVHLGKLFGENMTPFADLLEDPILTADVLYHLCGPQVTSRGLTEEQFKRQICGDVREQAEEALVQAVLDFFPSRRRGPMRAFLAKIEERMQELMTKAETELLQSTDSDSVLNTQESAESMLGGTA